jgi:hypothetical protein
MKPSYHFLNAFKKRKGSGTGSGQRMHGNLNGLVSSFIKRNTPKNKTALVSIVLYMYGRVPSPLSSQRSLYVSKLVEKISPIFHSRPSRHGRVYVWKAFFMLYPLAHGRASCHDPGCHG